MKFKVGDSSVSNLTIIENHFYKNHKIASFEFTFPFCSPNSKNTWEYTYELPEIKKEFVNDILENGEITKSDTFFFVENEMIMHNKVDYMFTE